MSKTNLTAEEKQTADMAMAATLLRCADIIDKITASDVLEKQAELLRTGSTLQQAERALERAITLYDATSRFIRRNPIGDYSVFFDEAMCDGACLADDCESARDESAHVLAALRAAQNQPDAGAVVDACEAALGKQRCRCSKAIRSCCLDCGGSLEPVINRGPLNSDQFDAVKAGDWFCKSCTSDAASTGYKYFFDSELPLVLYQQCDRCEALCLIRAYRESQPGPWRPIAECELIGEEPIWIGRWQEGVWQQLKVQAIGRVLYNPTHFYIDPPLPPPPAQEGGAA